MRDLLKRLLRRAVLRFAVVGTLNTGVDVAVYTLLIAAAVDLVVANLISTSCGLVVSYLLNRSFVFHRGRDVTGRARIRQAVLFVVVTGIGLWVLQPLVILACTSVLRPLRPSSLALILVPKLAATACTLIWNYVLYSRMVFTATRSTAIAAAVDPALRSAAGELATGIGPGENSTPIRR